MPESIFGSHIIGQPNVLFEVNNPKRDRFDTYGNSSTSHPMSLRANKTYISRDISQFGINLIRGDIPAEDLKTLTVPKAAVQTVNSTFQTIYNSITTENTMTRRFTGQEARMASNLLNDDHLRSQATDRQKVELIRRMAHYHKAAKDSDVQLHQAMGTAINNVIEDFRQAGELEKFMNLAMVNLEDTSLLLTSMNDWGARTFAKNDQLLSLTSAEQKVTLVWSLGLRYTYDGDQKAINKIISKAIDQGQFKDMLSIWSDNLDPMSKTLDSIYEDMADENRVEFLNLIKKGMSKEMIDHSVMVNLYGASTILEDIRRLNGAEIAKAQGRHEEAAEIFSDLGANKRARRIHVQEATKHWNRGDISKAIGSYTLGTKASLRTFAKGVYNNTVNFFEDGTFVMGVSHLNDQLSEKLKQYPSLQPKDPTLLTEKRQLNLDRLNARAKTLSVTSPEQKQLNHLAFEKKIDELTGTKAHEGNQVKLLLDGKESMDRLSARIDEAQESIYIEVFLFHDDEKGHEIADKLIAKAEEGLDVRVVTDWAANLGHKPVLEKLKDSKVKFEFYEGSFQDPIKNRGMVGYHRKLYIFDQKHAMTGGINLGSDYLTEGKWHDMLVEMNGPIMSDLLNNFYENWSFSAETELELAPPPESFKVEEGAETLPMDQGNTSVRLITTDPRLGEKDINTWMIEAINNAQDRVIVEDPYFNDPAIVQALIRAVNRNVQVDVIFPNSNDVPIFKHLDDNTLDELYVAGANVHSYNTNGKESFNHLKATVVDNMVSIGSANKDTRALHTNQEINVVIDDKDFAEQFIEEVMNVDIANSSPAKPKQENFMQRAVKEFMKRNPSLF